MTIVINGAQIVINDSHVNIEKVSIYNFLSCTPALSVSYMFTDHKAYNSTMTDQEGLRVST